MFSNLLKNLSILKKFLFINLVFFTIIGLFTFLYLKNVQPNLIKKKTSNHIKVIKNTTDNLTRLDVKFNEEDIRRFLFSTRFLFQNLDRVIFFDNELNLVGDTDTLDLDPRSFTTRLDTVELEILNEAKTKKIVEEKNINIGNKNSISLKDVLFNYAASKNYGIPYTFTQEEFNRFKLTTIKNVMRDDKNVGYLAITENANDIKAAIEERKTFIIRTAIAVGIVILIFSFVLNRYFLKPIKNLVSYTNTIKNKDLKKTNIDSLKVRNDELGLLSNSLDDMTEELQKRISHAENFSTDLVHEIRNPLASLKGASELLENSSDKNEREKLIKILSHDVERIDRLITDYSQMLKDEASLSREKMKKLDLQVLVKNVIDEFESNSKVIEKGFSETNTEKIFRRFYSNRPEKFGEHSGLGLNIVKSIVQMHGGNVTASNRSDNQKGAQIEVELPKKYNQ